MLLTDTTVHRRPGPAGVLPASEPDARHVCIVEDDPQLRHMLGDYFARHGLRVSALESAEALFAQIGRHPPDVLLLDVGLPGRSGLEVCRQLRSEGNQVPIVMLSALADEVDRVVGLEMGADDYQCKPFSARELLARVKAQLRRTPAAGTAATPAPGLVRLGEHSFDPAARALYRDGRTRVLNPVEHALLATLCRQPGVPVSREALHAAAHGGDSATLLRAVDAGMMRLRRLIEPDPAEPRYLQTVRGLGYMVVPGRHGPGAAAG